MNRNLKQLNLEDDFLFAKVMSDSQKQSKGNLVKNIHKRVEEFKNDIGIVL